MNSTKFDKRISAVTKLVLIIWLISMVSVVVFYWQYPQFSDAGTYCSLARECVSSNSWYPTPQMLTSEGYIFNPGYVNFLIVLKRIFGEDFIDAMRIINIIMNCISVYAIYKIANNLTNTTIANLTIILYCILWPNIIVVGTTMTEVPFMTLILLSALCLKKNYWLLLLSAVLLVIANYFRPISIIFVIAFAIYMIIQTFQLKQWCCWIIGLAIGAISILSFNHHISGKYFLSSTTGGVNMIMACHNSATGGYDEFVFRESSNGYIENDKTYNVFQKDSIYKSRSIEWIINNPLTFVKKFPNKIYLLISKGAYYEGSYGLNGNSFDILTKILRSFTYYIVLLLSLFGAYIVCKNLNEKSVLGVILIPVVLLLIMHLFVASNPRYFVPAYPIIAFLGAIAVQKTILKWWSQKPEAVYDN